jgi:chromate reductase, NAD(P)H dehydrogenase (quinone)
MLRYPSGVRILAICGSLQARSSNLDLLTVAVAAAPDGVEVVIFDGLRDLPLFNPDIEEAGAAPSSVQTWRRVLAESDAVLIATPEYGHSLPGSLKNAIDWVVGSGELERKVVAITASTNHPERGLRGLAALRDTLNAVSATIVGGEPIVRGATFEAEVRTLLAKLVEVAHAAGRATG